MRIMVLGSTGPIGTAVVACARAHGHHVVSTSRSAPNAATTGDEHFVLDRQSHGDVLAAIRARKIDVVVDQIAYTLAHTQPLLQRLDGIISRYVLVSSSDVYRNYGLLHRKEAGDAVVSIDEDSPLRESRFPYRGSVARSTDDPERWLDDYDKIPIESAVRSLSADWTILRLPMVYGPGDRQRRFRWILSAMLGDARELVIPKAWMDWLSTYGYIANVAAAVIHASTHAQAARLIANVADHPAVTHRDWIERFRRLTGWQGEVRESEAKDTSLAGTVGALDLSIPLHIHASRLTDLLAFAPPVDLETALAETIRAHVPGRR